MDRQGTVLNDITTDCLNALADHREPLKGVPGWVPEEVRSQPDTRPAKEGLPKSSVATLNKMGTMAIECNDLACGFDEWTVKNKHQFVKDLPEDGECDLSVLTRSRAAISAEWSSVRRMYYNVDEHLRNAMNYHQIHHDLDGMFVELAKLEHQIEELLANMPHVEDSEDGPKKGLLNKLKEVIKVKTDKEKTDATLNVNEAMNALGELFGVFLLLNAAAGVMYNKSLKIVPVHKRVKKIREAVPVTALCSFKTGKHVVNEGEPLFLVDNSNSEQWKVQNMQGQRIRVPAITIRIPPPDKKVVALAQQLQTAIKDLWIQFEDELATSLTKLAKTLLDNYLKEKSTFDVVSDKKKLVMLDILKRCLKVAEEHLSEEKDYNDLKNKLQEALDEIVDSTPEGDEVNRLKSFNKKCKVLDKDFAFYKDLCELFKPDTSSDDLLNPMHHIDIYNKNNVYTCPEAANTTDHKPSKSDFGNKSEDSKSSTSVPQSETDNDKEQRNKDKAASNSENNDTDKANKQNGRKQSTDSDRLSTTSSPDSRRSSGNVFLDDPIAAENPAATYNTQPPHIKDAKDVTNGDSKVHDTPNGISDDIANDDLPEDTGHHSGNEDIPEHTTPVIQDDGTLRVDVIKVTGTATPVRPDRNPNETNIESPIHPVNGDVCQNGVDHTPNGTSTNGPLSPTGGTLDPASGSTRRRYSSDMSNASSSSSMYVELPECRLSTVHEVISDAKGQMDLACKIKYAVDTKTGQLKTLEEAEELGVLMVENEKEMFVDRRSGIVMTIPKAIKQGLVIVDYSVISKDETKRSIELLDIERTKVTRPLTIVAVKTPDKQEELPVEIAIEEDIFIKDQCVYVNTDTGERLSLSEAIAEGYIVAEEDEMKTEVTNNYYFIKSIKNTANGKHLSIDVAVEQKILDEGTAHVVDKKKGVSMMFEEAIERGLVKAWVAKKKEVKLWRDPKCNVSAMIEKITAKPLL